LCTTGTDCRKSNVDRVNTRGEACMQYTIACCAQLELVGYAVCRLFWILLCTGACTGFDWRVALQPNTGLQAYLTASTRRTGAAHLFECSAALTVQLRLFAIYSGYCRMHRGLCSMQKRYSLQGPLYRRNTFK
jgi:hypothetical protein